MLNTINQPKQSFYYNDENHVQKKESPESMIRSLKGIFCRGRYSSWVFKREQEKNISQKRRKKNDKKLRS